MQMLPSPLDSPRFFDDAALSAWSVRDRRFAAARKSVSAKSLVYSASPTAPRLAPEHNSDAISIEIVRGSNGLADEGWTVLVDGMRCRPLHPILQEGETTFRCVLPPGVAPPNPGDGKKPTLNTNTKVRPVVVGIRLEEEALAPANAIIVIEQVLDTSERSVQDPKRPDIRTLKTIQLRPYRVSDLQSNAVVLQYPFHSPAQSVLGILSMDTAAKWKADQYLKTAWNFITLGLNEARESRYVADVRARTNKDPAYLASTTVRQNATQRYLTPSRPRRLKEANTTPEPTQEEATETFRIGGGRDSSARALGDLFATLSQACKGTRNILPGLKKPDEREETSEEVFERVKKHLEIMEVALNGSNDSKALALLRALCTTSPNHQIRKLVRPDLYTDDTGIDRSKVDEAFHFNTRFDVETGSFKCSSMEKSPAVVLEPETRKQLDDGIQENSLPGQMNDSPPYAFTYDRILLAVRQKTTVYTRFKVVVEQEDGSQPFSVEFVSDRQDGFVANSVYSGELDDIEYMDKESIRFIACLICGDDCGDAEDASKEPGGYDGAFYKQTRKDNRKVHAFDQDTSPQIKAAWFEAYGPGFVQTAGTLIRKFQGKNVPEHVANIETRVAELRILVREMLPAWPTPSPTAEDYEEMDQLSEQLEAQLEAALPGITSPVNTLQENTTDLGASEIGSSPALALEAWEDDVDERNNERSRAAAQKQTETDAAKKEDAEFEKKRLLEQIKAIEGADQEDDYSITYKAANREQLLIRQLPQIVKPNTVYISFQLPKSVNPPDQWSTYRPDATSSWWKNNIGIGSFTSVALAVFAAHVVLSTGVSRLFTEMKRQQRENRSLGLLKLISALAAKGAAVAAGGTTLITPTLLLGLLSTLAAVWETQKTLKARNVASLLSQFQLAEKYIGKLRLIANIFYNDSRARFAMSEKLEEASNAHFKEERGIPVNDAFAAAKNAASVWRKSEESRVASLAGVIKDASVVYNPYTGKRFRFVEYFELIRDEVAVVQYKPLYTDTQWASTSDVNAFRILPPSDVDGAYIQCVDQRGMSLAQTISFVTGSSYSYSRPSAQVAFSELYNTVMLSLKTMHSGQRVERSGPGLAVDLAEQGALVMKAVFGKAAGVTLVESDDILWTCLRASTFARLALRHLEVFSDAPSTTNKKGGTSGEFVRKSMQFWKSNRREAVDKFADALIVEAREKAQEASARLPPSAAEEEDSRKEANRRHDRVKALLAPPEVPTVHTSSIMSVVDSSVYTFQMPALQGDVCDKEAATTARQKTDTSNAFPNFEYQSFLQPPSVQKHNDAAAWASRRVDTSLGRSMCLGNGAESVMGAFASLNLGTNAGNAIVFYCPTGSRMDAVPASVPFDIDGINNRVVWTSALREAAENILCNIQQNTHFDANSWHIDAQPIGKNAELVGLARHPAALQTKANCISVQLSSQSGSVNCNNRVALMRRVAYNADRIFFALSLAYSYPQDTTLCILIPHQDVACLAIAVAMRHFEGGVPDIGLRVYLDGGGGVETTTATAPRRRGATASWSETETACIVMQTLVAQATAAFQIGCRVVSLAEAAMCVLPEVVNR